MAAEYENEVKKKTTVSFTEDELKKIAELKEWYSRRGINVRRTTDLIGLLICAEYERRIERENK